MSVITCSLGLFPIEMNYLQINWAIYIPLAQSCSAGLAMASIFLFPHNLLQ